MRKSNFELLRIISMMMVVGLHYLNPNMGGAIGQQSPGEINYYITYFLEGLFHTGVNCYILITGYFMLNKKSVSFDKVVNLLIMIIFYGALHYSVALLAGWQTFSIVGLVKGVLPILAGLKWFIVRYIILYLLIPYINLALNSMSKKGIQSFLLIMLFFFSLWPSMLPGAPNADNGYGIINFVVLYSIGYYLRKHYVAGKSKLFYLSIFMLCGVVTFVAKLITERFSIPFITVWAYDFLPIIIGSVSLFIFFSMIEVQSKLINYVSQFTLAVYFVHADQSTQIGLYRGVFKTDDFWHSPYFILHMIATTIILYIAGTIIGIAQKWLFDKVGELIGPIFKKHIPILWGEIGN